uniref:Deoxyuridine 5'-triphosphate nucleotidohydrolase n=1 Tax=Sinocyclocheilus rhinocerous TaxID=307959 RepID=A0A673M480_9TELE
KMFRRVSSVRGLNGLVFGRGAGVTEAVSPQKRCKSDAVNGHKEQVLKFAKLTENATPPSRGSNRAAGFDLHSAYDYSIGPMDKALVRPTSRSRFPRTGFLIKHSGVVDEDYRGNLGVVLFNFNKEPFEVKKGDRIAQLICERIYYPELQELQTLDETERGAGGFGSTGTN